MYQVSLPHLPDSLSLSLDQQTISLSSENKLWVHGDGLLPWAITQAPPTLLQSQLDSCEELLTEEPSNKCEFPSPHTPKHTHTPQTHTHTHTSLYVCVQGVCSLLCY